MSKAENRILITGCGRSGTHYMANLLTAAGMPCGHETVFSAYGDNKAPFRYESSWYAAPFISQRKDITHVIHLVRHPQKVMESFYRIGLLSDLTWRHITRGNAARFLRKGLKDPQKAFARINYVKQHRNFLKENSNIFAETDEVKRLERYWREWNQLIEDSTANRRIKYLRIKLEDIGAQLKAIRNFMEIEADLPRLPATNTKPKYAPRSMPRHSLSNDAAALAAKYGYDV
jgi:hypothetical protein